MLLVFDHGTSSVKTCLIDEQGRFVQRAQANIPSQYPQPAWVEQNPQDLWELTLSTAEQALKEAKATWDDVHAIGISNQRETCILWDQESGRPVYPAIVWQCRRTAELCKQLAEHQESIHAKTGLLCDPYFSGTKIRWILDNVPECQELLRQGRLRFGTVDCWVAWQLTGRQNHVTEHSNASRTLLYNIHEKRWDSELLELLGVPEKILPEVRPSNAIDAYTDPKLTGGRAIPLSAMAGDQQAALFGQRCWEPGQTKSTYGTGTFLMMNLGQNPVSSTSGLLCTLACDAKGGPSYALEGAVFISGAALEWLQNGLRLFESPQQADKLAASVAHNHGVYFVPAFVGLAAPYWNSDARGLICGLTQGVTQAHIARAAFEAMAYQTKEVIDLMQSEGKQELTELRVDGGVTRSRFFLQFLADLLQLPVRAVEETDLTAMGVAYLAGLASAYWRDAQEISKLPERSIVIEPGCAPSLSHELFSGWLEAVNKTLVAQQ